jgi:hypothetical protein
MKACSTPVHSQIDQRRKQAITSLRYEHERGVKPCSIEIGQPQMQLQISRIQLTTLGTRNIFHKNREISVLMMKKKQQG